MCVHMPVVHIICVYVCVHHLIFKLETQSAFYNTFVLE